MRPTIACTSTNGAAPTVPGTASARSATARQSDIRSGGPVTRRVRRERHQPTPELPSNPFMTEMMVISAATPRQTPSIDTHEMKDTKNPCRRVRT